MMTDGLTKGTISRQHLLLMMKDGIWKCTPEQAQASISWTSRTTMSAPVTTAHVAAASTCTLQVVPYDDLADL
eukprot:6033566-Amphidinium_carterae.1